MTFNLTETQNDKRAAKIEFQTLEELLKFIQAQGTEVILTPPNFFQDNTTEWTIELYNGYRET